MQRITPLDPNSDKGRRVAAELTELLGRLAVDIADRRAAAAATERRAV